jgi:hypothetical protein
MGKKILLLMAGILVSAIASTLLGHLALRLTNFGPAVEKAITNTPGNPMETTLHMVRLTVFVLDPIVAIIVGAILGLWSEGRPTWIGAIAVLPLAAFAAYSYPWLWPGITAGLIDLILAAGTAEVTYRSRHRGRAQSAH